MRYIVFATPRISSTWRCQNIAAQYSLTNLNEFMDQSINLNEFMGHELLTPVQRRQHVRTLCTKTDWVVKLMPHYWDLWDQRTQNAMHQVISISDRTEILIRGDFQAQLRSLVAGVWLNYQHHTGWHEQFQDVILIPDNQAVRNIWHRASEFLYTSISKLNDIRHQWQSPVVVMEQVLHHHHNPYQRPVQFERCWYPEQNPVLDFFSEDLITSRQP